MVYWSSAEPDPRGRGRVLLLRQERRLLGSVAVIVLLGAVWLVLRGPGGSDVQATLPATALPPAAASPVAAPAVNAAEPSSFFAEEPPAAPGAAAAGDELGQAAATILVHVAGNVARPGVYELPAGARVQDAVDAAGGPSAEAQLHALNLAAPLQDGSRIYVPSTAEAASVSAQVYGAEGAGAGGDASGPLNINTASLEQLQTLNGIGPVLAQRILDDRTRNGPYRSVDDLLRVSGIGPKLLAALAPHVTVH